MVYVKPADIWTCWAATLPSVPALDFPGLRSCRATSPGAEAYSGAFPFVEFGCEELEELLVGSGLRIVSGDPVGVI